MSTALGRAWLGYGSVAVAVGALAAIVGAAGAGATVRGPAVVVAVLAVVLHAAAVLVAPVLLAPAIVALGLPAVIGLHGYGTGPDPVAVPVAALLVVAALLGARAGALRAGVEDPDGAWWHDAVQAVVTGVGAAGAAAVVLFAGELDAPGGAARLVVGLAAVLVATVVVRVLAR